MHTVSVIVFNVLTYMIAYYPEHIDRSVLMNIIKETDLFLDKTNIFTY